MSAETSNAGDARPDKKTPWATKPWALLIGRICLTSCRQVSDAPLVERCIVSAGGYGVFRGLAVVVVPWKCSGDGKKQTRPALVIAWKSAPKRKSRNDLETEIRNLRAIAELVDRELALQAQTTEIFRETSRCLQKELSKLMVEKAAANAPATVSP